MALQPYIVPWSFSFSIGKIVRLSPLPIINAVDIYAPKLSPHPQLEVALGFDISK